MLWLSWDKEIRDYRLIHYFGSKNMESESCETFAQCGNIESESSETSAQSRTNGLGRCETFAQDRNM